MTTLDQPGKIANYSVTQGVEGPTEAPQPISAQCSKPRQEETLEAVINYAGDTHKLVGGAKLTGQIQYYGAVPGKRYKLDADMIAMMGPEAFQLISSRQETDFVADSDKGTIPVELTIDDRITTPVDQAYMDLSMMKFDPDEHPITDISDPIGDNTLTSEK